MIIYNSEEILIFFQFDIVYFNLLVSSEAKLVDPVHLNLVLSRWGRIQAATSSVVFTLTTSGTCDIESFTIWSSLRLPIDCGALWCLIIVVVQFVLQIRFLAYIVKLLFNLIWLLFYLDWCCLCGFSLFLSLGLSFYEFFTIIV